MTTVEGVASGYVSDMTIAGATFAVIDLYTFKAVFKGGEWDEWCRPG